MKKNLNRLENSLLMKMVAYDKFLNKLKLIHIVDKDEYFEYLLYLAFITYDNVHILTKYKSFEEFMNSVFLSEDEVEKIELNVKDYYKFVNRDYEKQIDDTFGGYDEEHLMNNIDHKENDLIRSLYIVQPKVLKKYLN